MVLVKPINWGAVKRSLQNEGSWKSSITLLTVIAFLLFIIGVAFKCDAVGAIGLTILLLELTVGCIALIFYMVRDIIRTFN